ncbi:MAG: metal-dependent hydrolase [Candidatus Helarchaeota archaeon]
MVSFISHMSIGIICAEIILLLKYSGPNSYLRVKNRLLFWSIGMLGGLMPDLDAIPAIIMGLHPYTFHHFYTHTFLALGIMLGIFLLFRKTKWSLPLFVGFGMHLVVDFIDNSISPLGPFFPTIEWGFIPGWGELPFGTWASEFWLLPGYENHDLWTIFMTNNWGFHIGFEFISYYDIIFILIFFIFLIIIPILIVQKLVNKNQKLNPNNMKNHNNFNLFKY